MAQTAIFRHRSRLGLAAAIVILGAAPAGAGDFNRMGFYVGAGASYTTDLYEDEIEDAISGVSVDIDSTPGFNVRAGLRFLKFLAAEVQYEWLDPYDIDLAFSGLSGTVEVKQQTFTGNLKVYVVPFWRIQPYILAGVGFQHIELDGSVGGGIFSIDDEETSLAGRAGLGVDVYLTKHIVIYGEGSVVLTDTEVDVPAAIGNDIDNIFNAGGQIGLMWRF